MPTQIVVAIDDPSNRDAWGLRPYGVWSAGSYPKGAVVTHSGSVWLAQQNTQQEPVNGSDWLILITSFNVDAAATQAVYPNDLDFTATMSWTKNDANYKWNSTQTSGSIRKPYLSTDATLDLQSSTPLDFPGATGGSYPVGIYASHRQIGGSASNNSFTHSIMAYALNSAIGDNDVIAISGRATKTDVVGGIGDAGGMFGSGYQLSTRPGMVMGAEFGVYQNVTGSTPRDRLDNNSYATSVAAHFITSSTGSPATSLIGMQSSIGSGFWGTWNGIVIDASIFNHNGNTNGRAGTVGINCGSWATGVGFPEYGIKFGDATWHIWRGNAPIYVGANNIQIGNNTSNSSVGYTARSNGSGNSYLDIGDNNSRGQFFWDATNINITARTIGAIPLVFQTNSIDRARITGSGDVLFSKSQLITSASSGYGWGFGSNGYADVYRNSSTAAEGVVDIYSDVGSARSNVFRIQANGNVLNTNNSYGALSDIKIKENISDAKPALEKICSLKVREYSLIKEKKTNADRMGFIAQELNKIIPQLVNDAGDDLLSVNYVGLIPYIVKAIQEIADKLES